MKNSYLKPETYAWFYLQCMIFDGYAGNGRKKKPEKTYIYEKQGKNSPFGFPPIPPSIKLEADCFPGRKYRKQAGPTLGGAGFLLYRDKRIKRVGLGMGR